MQRIIFKLWNSLFTYSSEDFGEIRVDFEAVRGKEEGRARKTGIIIPQHAVFELF